MADSANAVQAAIYTLLNGALGGSPSVPVYDHVPPAAQLPYITIGQDTAVDDGTKTFYGQEVTIEIHAWTANRGRREGKVLLGEVYGLLHEQSVTVTGWTVAWCRFDFSESFQDADPLVWHSLHRYRLSLQKS